MSTKFADDVIELLFAAQCAYERYRVEVVDTFRGGLVNPDELTPSQRHTHAELVAAEQAVAACRQRVHSVVLP